MPLNVELLRKVQKEITEEPKRLNMSSWLVHYDPKDLHHYDEKYRNQIPSCNTVGCIAGWTKEIASREGIEMPTFGVCLNACYLLNISEDEALTLFYADEWPISLRDRYIIADENHDYTERAKVTCEAIDAFIIKQTDREKILL